MTEKAQESATSPGRSIQPPAGAEGFGNSAALCWSIQWGLIDIDLFTWVLSPASSSFKNLIVVERLSWDPSEKQTRPRETKMQPTRDHLGPASPTSPITPTRPDPCSQYTDLMITDENLDQTPPPAYGDIYGEICIEKDGMGTSACVTDDGRVDI
ncbi:hypothetical protein DOTSEDRAFT_82227 [Dothistroma septosporum NZE10]|uniref:Uncharacterized protein n=1 Tax=Dothistroma septosporum (strain NZE10 / CBS 128990) TaxID=675120 RepID=N1PDE7_DOTSN|nr:hypothetical protein DOTSEDRAFT_82227 [Dothistroma septosporum NZE10]